MGAGRYNSGMYTFLRPLLFSLDAESAHHLTLLSLQIAARTGTLRPCVGRVAPAPSRVMGIDFPNPVGLAAGLDKNGEYIDALAALGFGFLEIGTITPRPQPGNPRPRMFRLPAAGAVINRMGFNNHGVDALLANVGRARYRGALGINIGKNFDTPIERAADDYLICLRKVYSSATYVTVNISSPNTKNLRQLQQSDELGQLLGALKEERARLADRHGRRVPLALKIAPDLDETQHRRGHRHQHYAGAGRRRATAVRQRGRRTQRRTADHAGAGGHRAARSETRRRGPGHRRRRHHER